jgi:hypothetical protein
MARDTDFTPASLTEIATDPYMFTFHFCAAETD